MPTGAARAFLGDGSAGQTAQCGRLVAFDDGLVRDDHNFDLLVGVRIRMTVIANDLTGLAARLRAEARNQPQESVD
jgi:hypothetical protein